MFPCSILLLKEPQQQLLLKGGEMSTDILNNPSLVLWVTLSTVFNNYLIECYCLGTRDNYRHCGGLETCNLGLREFGGVIQKPLHSIWPCILHFNQRDNRWLHIHSKMGTAVQVPVVATSNQLVHFLSQLSLLPREVHVILMSLLSSQLLGETIQT